MALTTLNELAAVPPKLTAVAPVKSEPVMVTVAPLAALVGVKLVIEGAATKTKPALVAVPAAVVTETSPVEPFATIA